MKKWLLVLMGLCATAIMGGCAVRLDTDELCVTQDISYEGIDKYIPAGTALPDTVIALPEQKIQVDFSTSISKVIPKQGKTTVSVQLKSVTIAPKAGIDNFDALEHVAVTLSSGVEGSKLPKKTVLEYERDSSKPTDQITVTDFPVLNIYEYANAGPMVNSVFLHVNASKAPKNAWTATSTICIQVDGEIKP